MKPPHGGSAEGHGRETASRPGTATPGGRDYTRSNFNRATYALRQPGSSIKPFVYARALLDSVPANTIIPDTALAITMPNGELYSPDNSDGQFMGSITMRVLYRRV